MSLVCNPPFKNKKSHNITVWNSGAKPRSNFFLNLFWYSTISNTIISTFQYFDNSIFQYLNISPSNVTYVSITLEQMQCFKLWYHQLSCFVILCHIMSSYVIWCHLMSSVFICSHLLSFVVIFYLLLSSDVTIARSYYFDTFW